jgi:imidazolonepropionase
MNLVIKNIGFLVNATLASATKVCGKDMGSMRVLNNTWLFCEDGKIHSWGTMDNFENDLVRLDAAKNATVVDAEGGMVAPSWCDSHTHIVYAAPREKKLPKKAVAF